MYHSPINQMKERKKKKTKDKTNLDNSIQLINSNRERVRNQDTQFHVLPIRLIPIRLILCSLFSSYPF